MTNKLGEWAFYVFAGSWPLVWRDARLEFDYYSPLLRALQGIFGVGKYIDFQMTVAQLRPLQAQVGGLTFDLDNMIAGIDERAFSSLSAWSVDMFRWRVALRLPAAKQSELGGKTICARGLVDEISASPHPKVRALLTTESTDYLREYVRLSPARNTLVRTKALEALLPTDDGSRDDASDDGGAAAPTSVRRGGPGVGDMSVLREAAGRAAAKRAASTAAATAAAAASWAGQMNMSS